MYTELWISWFYIQPDDRCTCLAETRSCFYKYHKNCVIIIIIIIINIKYWTLWSVPSSKLQLLSPTFLRSSKCSFSFWSVVVWFQMESVLWHYLQVLKPVPSVFVCLVSYACNPQFAADRSRWGRVLGASKPRISVKGAHPYRKRPCLEALRLANTTLTQPGTGYPSWGHTTKLRISKRSTGLVYRVTYIAITENS